MLDSRTTSVTTPKAELVSPRAKAASLLDNFTARQSVLDDPHFDSVLTDAVSDRKATPRNPRDDASADAQRSQRAKRPARERRNEPAGDNGQTGDAANQAHATPADGQDEKSHAADESSADAATGVEQAAGDAPPTDSPQPNGADQPAQSSASIDPAVAAAVPAAVGSALAAAAAGAGDTAGATPPPTNAAAGKSAARSNAGLAPLQWLAQQQAAKVAVKTADGQSATASPLANLFGLAKSASSALDVLKGPQEKVSAGQASEAVAAPTSHNLPVAGHSVTSDPTGLLNRSVLPAAGAATTPSAVLVPAVAGADAQAGSPSLVPQGDNATQNMHRLATVVHAAIGQQQSVTRMQLQPPELGAVTVVLQLRQSRMELKLEVASESARDLVSSGLDRLREALQQQGISLDRATVSVAPRSEQPTGDQQQSAWHGQQGHGSGMSDPGQGGQQFADQDRQTSFAIDVPWGAADGSVPAAVMSYATGLNVLA